MKETYAKPEPESKQLTTTKEVDTREVSGKILKLPLPNHLNHLMKLFEQFEFNLRIYRQRHEIWTATLEQLSQMI